MIVDIDESLPDLGSVDVCIVGGGAAGIVLAVELAKTDLKVVLVEEGGLTGDHASRPVYGLVPGTEISLGLESDWAFYLGGNTNHWYGNCRPLDVEDFADRDWIPDSGWPISRAELAPFYLRAQELAGLGSFDWYDVAHLAPALPRDAPLFRSDVLATKVVQVTPEFSFSALHRKSLEGASNVAVLLGTRVERLLGEGNRTSAIRATRNGSTVDIAADRFVIATGGVENARLLLTSSTFSADFGMDIPASTGRYFQEHFYFTFDTPLMSAGLVRRTRRLRLYNAGVGRGLDELSAYRQRVGDSAVWAMLVLSPETMRKRRLPGIAVWFSPSSSWSAPAELVALKDAVRSPRRLPGALFAALRHPIRNLNYVLRNSLRLGSPAEQLTMIVELEQAPDRRSRVTLADGSARKGLPDAALETGFDDAQLDLYAEAVALAAEEFGLDGHALSDEMRRKYQGGDFGFFWHHMGSTRMGQDVDHSVVDPDGRVHGSENLYVTGCSVFPTSGTAAPTLTIVALAVRLADHLAAVGASP